MRTEQQKLMRLKLKLIYPANQEKRRGNSTNNMQRFKHLHWGGKNLILQYMSVNAELRSYLFCYYVGRKDVSGRACYCLPVISKLCQNYKFHLHIFGYQSFSIRIYKNFGITSFSHSTHTSMCPKLYNRLRYGNKGTNVKTM